jgi:hypothetical protein
MHRGIFPTDVAEFVGASRYSAQGSLDPCPARIELVEDLLVDGQ